MTQTSTSIGNKTVRVLRGLMGWKKEESKRGCKCDNLKQNERQRLPWEGSELSSLAKKKQMLQTHFDS